MESFLDNLSVVAIVAVEWGFGGGWRMSGGRVSVCLLPSSSDQALGRRFAQHCGPPRQVFMFGDLTTLGLGLVWSCHHQRSHPELGFAGIQGSEPYHLTVM